MKSLFGGGAVIATAILSSTLLLSARASVAETPLSTFQKPKAEQNQSKQELPEDAVRLDAAGTVSTSIEGTIREPDEHPTIPAVTYSATAYCLPGRTASGRPVSKGLIAADPRVLPLGTRVRIDAGTYSGEYLVADTGGGVRGRKVDIWTPNIKDARQFGRRLVKLTVLSYPAKRVTPPKRRRV